MSDARYPKRTATGDYHDPVETPLRAAGRVRSDDPLAELARLIDEDPFADFNQRRREPSPVAQTDWRAGQTFAEPPVEVDPEYEEYEEAAEAGYTEPVEPDLPSLEDIAAETDYDRESTERLYADLAAASQRVEPSFGRGYYAEETGQQPDDGSEVAPGSTPDSGFSQPVRTESYGREADYDDREYDDTDPVFDETGYVPPYDGEVPAEAGGRRKGTLVVAGLLGLVILGGASALVYRGIFGEESDAPPPIIRADRGPSKIEPDKAGDEAAPQQGKLVYDRVGGNASSDEARIVPREEPVADVGGRQVRVIDPNQDGGTGLRGPAGDAAAEEIAGGEELPKRVRTVVVKPDGTIVGEIEAPKPAEPLQPAPLQPAPLPGAAPVTATPAAPEAATPAGETAQATDVPLPEPKPAELASLQPIAPQPAAPQPVAPQPAPQAAPQAAAPQPAPAPAASQPQPGASFVPPSAPATQARPKAGQPLQLNPDVVATLPATQQPAAPAAAQPQPQQQASAPAAAAPAATPTTTFPPGSFIVQVAASRSEEDARGTAASISQRYGGELSGYSPAIERADLGDRGIYYRVGVGPIKNQGEANTLCTKLKSAGLDCFVRRN